MNEKKNYNNNKIIKIIWGEKKCYNWVNVNGREKNIGDEIDLYEKKKYFAY